MNTEKDWCGYRFKHRDEPLEISVAESKRRKKYRVEFFSLKNGARWSVSISQHDIDLFVKDRRWIALVDPIDTLISTVLG